MSWLPWVRRRRQRLRDTPLPDAWRRTLEQNVPPVRRLDDGAAYRLEGLVQLFLDHKRFEGLGGLEITDEIRVTIAGQACLLLLGLDVELPYPQLSVIRVLPGSYRVHVTDHQLGVTREGTSHRLGESSRHGYVVLSWRGVMKGARDPGDGRNLVLHEFAHQLDTEDGVADGAPVLRDRGAYGPWATALRAAFEELQRDVAARRRGLIDAYGATNPAEFFAVATESFFEQPERMKARWPDVYEVMSAYYGQDPARGG